MPKSALFLLTAVLLGAGPALVRAAPTEASLDQEFDGTKVSEQGGILVIAPAADPVPAPLLPAARQAPAVEAVAAPRDKKFEKKDAVRTVGNYATVAGAGMAVVGAPFLPVLGAGLLILGGSCLLDGGAKDKREHP